MMATTGIQIFDNLKQWQKNHDNNTQVALAMLDQAKTPQEE